MQTATQWRQDFEISPETPDVTRVHDKFQETRFQARVRATPCMRHSHARTTVVIPPPPNDTPFSPPTCAQTFKPPGGASSSHAVGSGTAVYRPRPGSKDSRTSGSVTATPGIAAEWPRAGWGPGSLTVSRPPRASGASETARSTAAVMAAFAGPADAVLRAGRALAAERVRESVDGWSGGVVATDAMNPRGVEVQGDPHSSSSSNSVSAAARAHSLRQSQSQSSVRPMMSSSQPLSEEAWGGGDGGQRVGGEEEGGDALAMGKADDDDGNRFPGGESNTSAPKIEGGIAGRPPSDEFVGMLFGSVDDPGEQVGGFRTDGSMLAEGACGEHSTAGDGQGGDGGGSAKGIGTIGREPPQQGKQRSAPRRDVHRISWKNRYITQTSKRVKILPQFPFVHRSRYPRTRRRPTSRP